MQQNPIESLEFLNCQLPPQHTIQSLTGQMLQGIADKRQQQQQPLLHTLGLLVNGHNNMRSVCAVPTQILAHLHQLNIGIDIEQPFGWCETLLFCLCIFNHVLCLLQPADPGFGLGGDRKFWPKIQNLLNFRRFY